MDRGIVQRMLRIPNFLSRAPSEPRDGRRLLADAVTVDLYR
jgi:hypothetical protein